MKPCELNKKVLSSPLFPVRYLLYLFRPNTNQLKTCKGRILPAVSICVILMLFLPWTKKTGLKADAVIQSNQDGATRNQGDKKICKKRVLLNKASVVVEVFIVKGRYFQWQCGTSLAT